MVKLSIIVPVYNVERYLAKCLDSLVQQTYTDLEIIVVNDGSLDQSQSIIDTYQSRYPKIIQSLQKPNGGLSDARNVGLKNAKGDYVAFVDSDDYVDLNLYQTCMDTLESTQADIAVFDLWYEYENGTQKKSSGGDFSLIHPQEYSQTLLINNSACNKVFRKEFLQKHPFIVGIWYEDLATIPLVLLEAQTVVKVNDVYYHYLQRESSIVHTQNTKIFDIYTALTSIQAGLVHPEIHNKAFYELCVIQGVYLTNLRIKDYTENRIHYWQENHQRIEKLYPNWYLDSKVWTMGFKKWIIFTLFKLNQFSLLDRIFNHD